MRTFLEKFIEISEKLSGINVAKILRKYLENLRISENLKKILNKILGIFGKNFGKFCENSSLIISKF